MLFSDVQIPCEATIDQATCTKTLAAQFKIGQMRLVGSRNNAQFTSDMAGALKVATIKFDSRVAFGVQDAMRKAVQTQREPLETWGIAVALRPFFT